MSADGWELTVPEDDAELVATLRRHGVRPGQRLRIVTSPVSPPPPGTSQVPRFAFAGTDCDAPSDLASESDHYLAEGFGRS